MCNFVCRITLNAETAKEFKEKIEDEYRVNMWGFYLIFHTDETVPCDQHNIYNIHVICDRILDNLPVVVPIRRPDMESSFVYQHGFHVGLRGQYAGVSA